MRQHALSDESEQGVSIQKADPPPAPTNFSRNQFRIGELRGITAAQDAASKTAGFGTFCARRRTHAEHGNAVAAEWNNSYRLERFVPCSGAEKAA
jgi:hypothetical protein